MTDKQLKTKAINIQGKQYVLVADRVIYFNDTYPNGMIQTSLVSEPDAEMVVVRAKVTPEIKNPERFFTGYSQAKWGEGMVNKTAALENCETSAIGRALGFMGIGVIDSVASVDEMRKAGANGSRSTTKATGKATSKQVYYMKKLSDEGKISKGIIKHVSEFSLSQAMDIIDRVNAGDEGGLAEIEKRLNEK